MKLLSIVGEFGICVHLWMKMKTADESILLFMSFVALVVVADASFFTKKHVNVLLYYFNIDVHTDLPSLVDFDFVLCKHLDFDKSFDLYFQSSCVYF